MELELTSKEKSLLFSVLYGELSDIEDEIKSNNELLERKCLDSDGKINIQDNIIYWTDKLNRVNLLINKLRGE